MSILTKRQPSKGFTIVELLIVIVVIGILAAITIVSFNGVQSRARTTKINTDITNLQKAITAARITNGGTPLRYVTNNTATGSNCWGKPDGTDLAALSKADGCWVDYLNALTVIKNIGGIDVTKLVDPWGRPYYIDENEAEATPPTAGCNTDKIGYYAQSFTSGQTMTAVVAVPLIQPSCL